MDDRKTPDEPAKDVPSKPADLPTAGPHADEALTDETKTPGTGALPEPGKTDEIDPGGLTTFVSRRGPCS